MYKVILVDDENFITAGLSAMIDWNSYNLEVIAACSSGSDFFDLFENNPADIVITDICMPDINGLELIERVKSTSQEVKFIILSGYDDFKYVREGIRLGIENYLLKPINRQELIQTLKNTVEKIERTLAIERFAKNDFNILRDNVLYRWVTNSIDFSELMERSSLLSINMDYKYYSATCLKIVSPFDASKMYLNKDLSKSISSLYSICTDVISGLTGFMSFCDLGGNIVIIAGSDDEISIKSKLDDTLRMIIERCTSILELNLFITSGDVQSSYFNLHQSYQQSIDIQDYELIMPENKVIYYNDIVDINKKNTIKEKLNLVGFSQILALRNIDKTLKFIDDFFDKLKKDSSITPADIHNYVIEILLLIIKHSEDNQIFTDLSKKDFSALISKLVKTHSILALKDILKSQVTELFKHNDSNERNLTPIVNQVLNYVNLNFTKDICLKSLGASFNINAAYLGQLFQKEIGVSLSEYVNNLRMEKSKELLLTTTLKNADIAKASGFYDSNYFYRKFKEYYKLSPSEFRSSLCSSL